MASLITKVSLLSRTTIFLEFDNAIGPTLGDLQTIGNYTLDNGRSISAADGYADRTAVSLTVNSALDSGVLYTLTLSSPPLTGDVNGNISNNIVKILAGALNDVTYVVSTPRFYVDESTQYLAGLPPPYGGTTAPAEVPVSISSVQVLSSTSIRVNFSEVLNVNTALTSNDVWGISPTLTISNVEPEAPTQASYVIITVSEMTQSQAYTVSLYCADGGVMTGNFTGTGTSPTVASAQALSGTSVKITFSEGMTNNADLLDPTHYVFTPGGGSNAITADTVSPEGVTYPTYVTVTLDAEMTIGTSNYSVEVSDLVIDSVGNTLDPGNDTATFSGVGIAPAIVSLYASYTDRRSLYVKFNRPVKQVSAGNSDDALNVSNYSLYETVTLLPITIFSISTVSSSEVKLTTATLSLSKSYSLDVVNIEDLAGNPV